MSPPKISVLMPLYRNPNTVRRAIRSILKQTHADFELIIVENGSDEKTRAAVRSISDERMRLFSLPDPGIVPALNLGLQYARGEYIARMDADDFSHPRRLELQAQALDRCPRLTLISSLVRFRSRLNAAGFARYVDWQNGLQSHRDIVLGQFIESPLVHPSVMFRRSAVEAVGGYRNGDFPEDYDLWLRLLAAGAAMRKLPETLVVWRDHSERLTRNDRRYYEKAFHALKAPYLSRFVSQRIHRDPTATEDGVTHSPEPGRKLVIWGAGKLSRRFSSLLLDHGLEIAAYIDIDPRKIGRQVRGQPVLPPESLRNDLPEALPEVLSQEPPGDPRLFTDGQRPFVLSYVAGGEARGLIAERLESYGFRPGRDFLMAA